ncbi:tyrosine-type recombinase/integrase [Halovenus sp. HT40]|uniref:tyrosine-type recombinase/integrase n=1 Tax=Halovenus sp. HT40 TaxID=3126691 RepID=UPI00300EB86E
MSKIPFTGLTKRLQPLVERFADPDEADFVPPRANADRFDLSSPLASAYLDTHAEIRLCLSSVDTYQHHLREFIVYLEGHSVTVLTAELTDIIEYIEWCVERGNRRSTIEGKLTTITEFYKFIHLRTEADEALVLDPLELETIDLSKYNTPPKIQREPLSREEVRRLYDAMDSYRNRLLAVVAVETGLRNSDLRELRMQDVAFDTLLIHVRDPKNTKPYDVPISRALGLELEIWCDEYQPAYGGGYESEYLFPGQTAPKLKTNGGLNQIIKSAADDAGIQAVIDESELTPAQQEALNTNQERRQWHRVTVHTLRHSCLTLMKQDGVPLQYRQLVANHTDPSTTQSYSHGQEEEFAAVRDQFEPPR